MSPYPPLASLRRPWLFGLLLLLALPVLLFSSFLPDWVPIAAVVYLAVLYIWRGAVVKRWLGHTPLDLPLLLLLIILPLGLWVSIHPDITLARSYAFIANLALFAAIAAQRDTPWLQWSGWVLLLGGLGLAFFLLPGTRFLTEKLPFIGQDIYSLLPGGFRPFWNPKGFQSNLTGGLIALFIPPAVMLFFLGAGVGQRVFALITAAVLMALLVLSQSRGAIIGLAIALPLIASLQSKRWRWFWWLVALLSGVALLAFGSIGQAEMFLGPNETLGSNNLLGRVELWSRALYIAASFSFSGVGLGMFQPIVRMLYPTFLLGPSAEFLHPHNIYLQALAEMGYFGLIAHLAIYVGLGYLLVQRARERTAGIYRTLALGLLGTLIVFLIHGLFEVITYAPRAAIIVWGLFGLMVAVSTSRPELDIEATTPNKADPANA